MKIGVIGGGVVGRATARTYLEHVDEVRVYDVIKERRTHSFDEVVDEECSVIFVCLPERHVEDLFRELGHSHLALNFVLKSTVPIGTTRRLAEQYHLSNLVHSPEFLTARCAEIDAQIPARNIIGSPNGPCVYGPQAGCYDRLFELYENRFPGIPVFNMSSNESEAVKLFVNSFFAVKVAFWNEVNTLATALGLDWDRVMEGVLSDGRISPHHTKVPGPDGKYGFGGTCLPKDLQHLIDLLQERDLSALVSVGASLRNFNTDRLRK